MDAGQIIEWITQFGLEYFQVYPGQYRGMVVRVDDPEERGRIQAHVPQVGQARAPSIWIPPAFNGAGTSRGTFWPPEVGDTVYVTFRLGKPERPQCYFGGYYGAGSADMPSEFAYTNGRPETRGFITRGGHRLVFSDEPGNESVKLTWHQGVASNYPQPTQSLANPAQGATSSDRSEGQTASLEFNEDGHVVVTDKAGQSVTLGETEIRVEDAHGNAVILDASGATIKADSIRLSDQADTPAMRFQDWLQWASRHTHPTSVGPSGPPVEPPPTTIGSSVVTLK